MPTNTPEGLPSRIELPGGWSLHCELPDYQPKVFSLKEPNGTGRACMFEEYARAFAKDVNDAVELTADKVRELANCRGKSIIWSQQSDPSNFNPSPDIGACDVNAPTPLERKLVEALEEALRMMAVEDFVEDSQDRHSKIISWAKQARAALEAWKEGHNG